MIFSILIPTWNNISFLKLCIRSIRHNSAWPHEILVHINEGNDDTKIWLDEQGIYYSESPKNIGVCLAVNHLAALAKSEWLVFMNDDMYCCPGWDSALAQRITAQGNDRIFLSSLLIEPTATGNKLVKVQNYGELPELFDETRLLREHDKIEIPEMHGFASQPTVIAKRWWMIVGGYSLEFSPGMSSDDDLLIKLWIAGFRDYIICTRSHIYHFACRSTGRIRKNKGSRSFVLKWGLTHKEFKLHLMQDRAQGKNTSFPRVTLTGRLKRAWYGLSGLQPLGDIERWDADSTVGFEPKPSSDQ